MKNYQLDNAWDVFKDLEGPCRDWGLPYNVKWLQDVATLRCKQNRQADSLVVAVPCCSFTTSVTET